MGLVGILGLQGLVGGKSSAFFFGKYLGAFQLVDSNRSWSPLLGPEFDRFERRQDENFAIAIVPIGACPSNLLNRCYGPIEVIIVDHNLDSNLSQDVGPVLNPTIDRNSAGRLRELLRIANRNPLDADIFQRGFERAELGRLDHGDDQSHFSFAG